jgi:hypothetical protein
VGVQAVGDAIYYGNTSTALTSSVTIEGRAIRVGAVQETLALAVTVRAFVPFEAPDFRTVFLQSPVNTLDVPSPQTELLIPADSRLVDLRQRSGAVPVQEDV